VALRLVVRPCGKQAFRREIVTAVTSTWLRRDARTLHRRVQRIAVALASAGPPLAKLEARSEAKGRRGEGFMEMANRYAQRLAAQAGYSLIELVVAAGIFGILASAGLPHVDTRRQDLNTSINRAVADLRYARSRAITTGDHFVVVFDGGNRYEIKRMELGAGGWTPSAVVKTVELPSHIEWLAGGTDSIEFNTRGMMISAGEPLWPSIWDTLHNHGHQISIWPSGQVYAED
jgi:prepilin-type N-terminal cleavage/methylation domain-containing protein